MSIRRKVLLVQLPIPQPGMSPAEGNVPLAAGYLKLFARLHGLDDQYDIEILPPMLANTLGDVGLVEAILERDPWLVGFTSYLWNIDRNLWIAGKLKEQRPDLRVLLGGPEITADNAWVLDHPAVDFAAIGEGEQTFVELLQELADSPGTIPAKPIAGLFVSPRLSGGLRRLPDFRKPLPNLNQVSSPYLEGILDAADEQMLLLETIRGCIFKCKFCYYPKSYDALYFVSREKIVANLAHAREHGAHEVVLLDPTLNQRKDFADFLRLLAECNPGRLFTYFGELRAEGITAEIAGLLREANFTQVEIGLQSIDPLAQDLMDRKNNLKAFEKGVRALRAAGISVKVDMIIGLPGDTVDSIRRGMHYLRDSNLYDEVQVFNLAILPGTAFRQEAEQLGLRFQPRAPYYVLETPTLKLADFYELMAEAQEIFETEFDPLPPPELPGEEDFVAANGLVSACRVDFDDVSLCSMTPDGRLPAVAQRSQAFTLWLRGTDLPAHVESAIELIGTLLGDNPHTTLQLVLEPTGSLEAVDAAFLDRLRSACYRETSYLDRFYAMFPGVSKGAKRLIVLLPSSARDELSLEWIDELGIQAALVWHGGSLAEEELAAHEFVLS